VGQWVNLTTIRGDIILKPTDEDQAVINVQSVGDLNQLLSENDFIYATKPMSPKASPRLIKVDSDGKEEYFTDEEEQQACTDGAQVDDRGRCVRPAPGPGQAEQGQGHEQAEGELQPGRLPDEPVQERSILFKEVEIGVAHDFIAVEQLVELGQLIAHIRERVGGDEAEGLPEEEGRRARFPDLVRAVEAVGQGDDFLPGIAGPHGHGLLPVRVVADIEVEAAVCGNEDEVFAEIKRLLDDGYADLKAAGSSFSFTLSSGFSGLDTPSTFAQFNRAIAARVAVYDDQWQNALDALEESFIDPSGDLDFGAYHVYSSGLNDQGSEMYEDPTASFIKLMAHPSFANDAESGDLRFASKVTVRDTSLPVITYDNLTSNLAPTMWSSNYDPVSIIRNEELILLRAEANIGLGNYSEAEADLNIVRSAAGLAPYSGTDASNALDRLLYEKRYSLFLEGHRLIDMRHYDRLDELPIDRADDVIVTFPIPETEIPG